MLSTYVKILKVYNSIKVHIKNSVIPKRKKTNQSKKKKIEKFCINPTVGRKGGEKSDKEMFSKWALNLMRLEF